MSDYSEMLDALIRSAKRFPNCKIANCDCNSKKGERIGDCYCLCHLEVIEKLKKAMQESTIKKGD